MTITSLEKKLELINRGDCPLGLTIDLSYDQLKPDGMLPLIGALKSGQCREALTLNLSHNSREFVCATELAKALETGLCPESLTICLDKVDLQTAEVIAFADALTSGRCPKGLTLSLSPPKGLEKNATSALANALATGNCPQGLVLNLAGTNLGRDDAIVFARALERGACPEGLTLNLGANLFRAEDIKLLVDALKSRKCPEGFTLSLRACLVRTDEIIYFAQALANGDCPKSFALDLGGCFLGAHEATHLALALRSRNCPEGLALNLRGNELKPAGATALADALTSGKCPKGLTLDLSHNKLGSVGATALADALKSGHCPKGLTLNLRGNDLEPACATAFTEALILTPGVNILGLGDFPLVNRASQLAQYIALLWTEGNVDDEGEAAADAACRIVEIIEKTPELLVILISQLIKTNVLNDRERHDYAGLINELINKLELTAELKGRISKIAANSEFEDVVKDAEEMKATRGRLPDLLTNLKAGFEINEIEKRIREVLSGHFALLTLIRDDIATVSEFSITLDRHISSITQANLNIEVMGFLGSLAELIASSGQAALQPYISVLRRLQFKVSTPDSLEKIQIDIPAVELCLQNLALLTNIVGGLVKSGDNTMGSSLASQNRHAFFVKPEPTTDKNMPRVAAPVEPTPAQAIPRRNNA